MRKKKCEANGLGRLNERRLKKQKTKEKLDKVSALTEELLASSERWESTLAL